MLSGITSAAVHLQFPQDFAVPLLESGETASYRIYVCPIAEFIYGIFKHWPYAWLIKHKLCLEEIICYIFILCLKKAQRVF